MRYDRLGGGVMIAGNAPAVVGPRDYAGNFPKLKGIEEVYQNSPNMDKSIPEIKYHRDRPNCILQENDSSLDLLIEVSDRLVDVSNLVSSARILQVEERSHDEVTAHDGPPEQLLSTVFRLYPPLMLVEEIPEMEVDEIFELHRGGFMMPDRRSQRNLCGAQSTSTRSVYEPLPLEATEMGELDPSLNIHRMRIYGAPSLRRQFPRQDSFQSHTGHDCRSRVSLNYIAHLNERSVVPQSNFALDRQPSMQRASSFRRRGSHDSSTPDMTYRIESARSQHSVGPRYNISSLERAIMEEPESPLSRNHLNADDLYSSECTPPDESDHFSNVPTLNSRYNANRRYGDVRVEYNSERHMRSCAADNHFHNGNPSQPSYQRRFSHQPSPAQHESNFMMNRSELNAIHHHPNRTSLSSASQQSNSSRMLSHTMSFSSIFPSRPSGEGRRTIEISPGLFATIRGAEETKQAIDRNFVIHPDCMSCNINLTCIADADYVICPDCKVISPSGSSIAHSNDMEGGGGVGLGLRTR